VATLLCGDFNTKAGSQGYMMIVDGKKYVDQFLLAASPAVFVEVFRKTLPGRAAPLANDSRIDFIFAKKNSKLNPIATRVLFSGQDYRRVSDHLGYLVEFEPSCGRE
jgi:maltose 6'-phosphate phosphatase